MSRDVALLAIGLVLAMPLSLLVNIWLQPLVVNAIARRNATVLDRSTKEQQRETELIAELQRSPAKLIAVLLSDFMSAVCLSLVGLGLIIVGFGLGFQQPDIPDGYAFSSLNNFISSVSPMLSLAGVALAYAAGTPFRRVHSRVQMLMPRDATASQSDDSGERI